MGDDFAAQHRPLELRQAGLYLAPVVDDGGNAVVGAAQQRLAVLERPHPRHLEMLVRADGGAEPGVVADGEQQVGVGGGAGHQVLVDDLVADGGGDAVTAGAQQRLLAAAGAEGRHRQVEETDGAAQPLFEGHVLAKRYQVALVIDAGALTDGDHRVVVQPACLGGDAGDQGGVVGLCLPVDPVEEMVDPVAQLGNCRFRPDDQIVVPQFRRFVVVDVEDPQQGIVIPFLFQRQRGLQQGDLDWRACRSGPAVAREAPARQPQQTAAEQRGEHRPAVLAQPGQLGDGCPGEGGDPAEGQDSAERGPAGEPAVDMPVAQVQPREAGQEPAAKPLRQHPQ